MYLGWGNHVCEHFLQERHGVFRHEAAHEQVSLSEKIMPMNIGKNCCEQNQGREQRHYKVVGERRRHLQSMFPADVLTRAPQSLFEPTVGHNKLDAVSADHAFRPITAIWQAFPEDRNAAI